MATINVRGYKIRVQVKAGTQFEYLKRMYEQWSDERLAQLADESVKHQREQPLCATTRDQPE